MNIDRHNYETFFLMYIDNELPDTEKKLVDEFVRNNPDLQEELIMLQQSVAIPDRVIFNDKEALYKNQFDTSGLQEKLFLHLDNELSASESEILKSQINADNDLKKEWDILQQTKLVADELVVFANKEVLYRKENGKVVAFPWIKLAVAAVFLGFIVWGGIAYVNNKAVKDDPIATTNNNKPAEVVADTKQQKAVPPIKSAVKESKASKEELAVVKPTQTNTSGFKKVKPAEKLVNRPQIEIPQRQIANHETNNLPEAYLNNINKSNGNKRITAGVTPEMQANTMNDPGNQIIENHTIETASSFVAATASLTEASEENYDRILFMNEEKVKKTKLGGFLRKATRVLERSTKIKPGGSHIKVANLEFAIQ